MVKYGFNNDKIEAKSWYSVFLKPGRCLIHNMHWYNGIHLDTQILSEMMEDDVMHNFVLYFDNN